jgi:N-methylhydantoinase A
MGTEELKEVFRALEASGREFLAGEEGHIRQIQVERILDVRYIGQSKEVAVLIPDHLPLRKDLVYKEFERLHQLLYGTQLRDPAEIVNVRVTVSGIMQPVQLRPRQRRQEPKEAT